MPPLRANGRFRPKVVATAVDHNQNSQIYFHHPLGPETHEPDWCLLVVATKWSADQEELSDLLPIVGRKDG